MPGRRIKTGVVPCRESAGAACLRGRHELCECELRAQNDVFAGTGGVSHNNRPAGFVPAYLNTETGEARISCYVDGRPAPVSWTAYRNCGSLDAMRWVPLSAPHRLLSPVSCVKDSFSPARRPRWPSPKSETDNDVNG